MKTRKLLTVIIAILAFAATNIQAQVPSYVPTNGLVGNWGFNGNANDQSGNGNNGTVNGATLTTDRNGNANSAYSFDASQNSKISLPLQQSGITSYSISAWFKTTSEFSAILAGRIALDQAGLTLLIHGGKVFYFVDGGNIQTGKLTTANYNDNQWHHVVGIYNGTPGIIDPNQFSIYVDNLLVSQTNIVNGYVTAYSPINNGTNLLLGVWGQGYDFNGKIDDLSIFNRALTQSEITQLYSSTESIQNLCTKTIQPYNVNVGDATHEGSTYAWSISPEAPNAIINGNGTNAITIDWTNVPNDSYTLQAIETSLEGCISSAVRATINLATPTAPVAQPQTFCDNATVANLVATGTNLQWYSVVTGGTALDSGTPLASGIYYVSNNLGTCESQRTAVAITINSTVIPTFTQVASTCSGTAIMALPTISNNGITGTWSPAINNSETTTYTFTPDASQCAAPTTQTITITTPKITSRISFVAPVASLPNVTIGSQVWTNKNLDVVTYRDGTPIPQVTDPTEWSNLTTGAWCYYNNDPANGAIYGKLYNWYAVAGIYDDASLNDPSLRKQFAPIGWHVPSDSEWTTLTGFLGGEGIAGGKMKEIGTSYWNSPNVEATNESGFTGLPGGYCVYDGAFGSIGGYCSWWSSSEYHTNIAYARGLDKLYGIASRNLNVKTYGFSVRLIKD
jgi:uncharacterized protein (TIGR02145 family)